MYRFCEVDGFEEADTLADLHRRIFEADVPPPTDYGHWWIGTCAGVPVAFAGLVASTLGPGIGYLKRAGVAAGHRGRGLQRRMITLREMRARRNGWHRIVTDTTDNVASANNLMACGYRLFRPEHPWAFRDSLYWTKNLSAARKTLAPCAAASFEQED